MTTCFITFEGGEAAGKSTQVRRLAAWLRRGGAAVTMAAEPGGTALGRRLRRLVKYARAPIGPRAEALLFVAARAQLVEEVVRPALARGEVVVLDRYGDSTLAYQGYGRGLDVAELRRLNAAATGGLTPGLTVLLDMPPAAAAARRRARAGDRFEGADTAATRDAAFHERVREGFLALAHEEPERWLVVDAAAAAAEVAAQVRERAAALLGR